MFKCLRKAVKHVMNKTYENINATKKFIIDISENNNAKNLISNCLIGLGVIGVLIKLDSV